MSTSDVDPLGKPFADCCCFSNVDRVSNRQSERGGRTVDIGSELSTSPTDSETYVRLRFRCPLRRRRAGVPYRQTDINNVSTGQLLPCLLPPADRTGRPAISVLSSASATWPSTDSALTAATIAAAAAAESSLIRIIFTALHGMQTRSSDGNSLCPSVCLSVRLSVRQTRGLWQNGRKLYLDFYIIRKNILVFWEGVWLVGGDPFYLKFWVNRPALERNRRFWTDNRS